MGPTASQLFLEKLTSIARIEENRLENRPNVGVTPMLTQDISRVDVSCNVVESHHSWRNALSYLVE